MYKLIAKVHGTEVDSKYVTDTEPLTMHQFMFEASRIVDKKFRDHVKIEVKKINYFKTNEKQKQLVKDFAKTITN